MKSVLVGAGGSVVLKGLDFGIGGMRRGWDWTLAGRVFGPAAEPPAGGDISGARLHRARSPLTAKHGTPGWSENRGFPLSTRGWVAWQTCIKQKKSG